MDLVRAHASRPRLRRIAILAALAALATAATLGLRALRSRPPAVERGGLWVDTVKRGALRLAVRGTGVLVPEEVRWASAPMSARVERIRVQPGAAVTSSTVLVELANPDAELAVLDAERELATAQADLARLSATLDGARLAQESLIATLDSDRAIARRRATIEQEMAARGVTSSLESAESGDRAIQLEGRIDFERRRLVALRRGDTAQLAAQRAEIDRLVALAEFRRRQLAELKITAGTTGVVQAVPVEVGMTVAAGQALARVVRPDRLKAELRIPETAGPELRIGLAAMVDTRQGEVAGTVSRVDPAAKNGSIAIDITFTAPLPRGARPDLTVDGEVEVAEIDDSLYVGRPAVGEAHARVALFKVSGDELVRVPVQLGRASVDVIEITSGLAAGDQVVLSDMSRWDGIDRLALE